jgi:SAM-dependent methyltransferase
MICRHCGSPLDLTFVDLGTAPPSNAYLDQSQLCDPEQWFPLRVLVCQNCWLVQTEDFVRPDDLFSFDYAYFSSYSDTWLKHAEACVATMAKRFILGPRSLVAEIASNDGYLLQFVQARGIPCYGVEPAARVAEAAIERGIDVVQRFFGHRLAEDLAAQGRQADLIVANNVLAHVPDINDFLSGIASLLKPNGTATFEFPYLMNLVAENQFDTIYHEHYSYFSLTAVTNIFRTTGLSIFDVEELPTHGGSLRVFAQRLSSDVHHVRSSVSKLLERESVAGVNRPDYYAGFQTRAEKVKNDFLEFLLEQKRLGRRVIAYGAAAKGNTLLNYSGIRRDLISFVVDRNPTKQGKFLPGSRIPIVAEGQIRDYQPHWVVILPWNIKQEIMDQLTYIREWGGRFITAVPSLIVCG